MNNLNRKLSQVLLSKTGGNVDHTTKTVLCELIDNCLDNQAKTINIKLTEDSKYIEIYDDGNGMDDIGNIFLANKGKINKKGCKNQGFLDSLAYLSNIEGELEIVTYNNDKYSRISVDFNEMKAEYNKQLQFNADGCIDYEQCQQKLSEHYTLFNNRHTKDYLKSHTDILAKIGKGGTYIKMHLYKDFELEDIETEYFQYSYEQEFTLNYLDHNIDINNTSDICISDTFIPVICDMYVFSNIEGHNIYKFKNNFNNKNIYYKETSIFSNITLEKYNEYRKKNTKEVFGEEHVASLKFSLISSDDAEKQKQIYDTGIEKMRQLFISYQNKTIGPFKFPTKIKGITPRNLLNIRIILEIKNDDLIKDIIMTNKSHTNLDCVNKSIIKFIEYCRDYFSIDYTTDIGKEFKKSKKDKKPTPGIPNMIKYLKDEYKKTQLTLVEQAALKAIAVAEELKKKEEAKAELKKLNYQPWKMAIYFEILDCNGSYGISAKDDFIKCHYDITQTDPNSNSNEHNLGTNGRIILYTCINQAGCIKTQKKHTIVLKLQERIKSIEKQYGIKMENDNNKCFKCPKEHFHIIYKNIREIITEYEGPFVI